MGTEVKVGEGAGGIRDDQRKQSITGVGRTGARFSSKCSYYSPRLVVVQHHWLRNHLKHPKDEVDFVQVYTLKELIAV